MAISAETLRSLVSISQFSKGQATQVFDRLKNEPQLVVLKNNVPAAILLSPDEFSRLAPTAPACAGTFGSRQSGQCPR